MPVRRLTILILALLCALLIATIFFDTSPAPARAQTSAQYAKILPNTYLYSRNSGGFFRVTSLPPDYFVLVVDRTDPQFFGVAYHDLLGHVRRTSVQLVTFEPVTRSAVGVISVHNGGLGVHMRDLPDHTLPNPVWIPPETLLEFYGTLDGTALHPLLGTIWFYVRRIEGGRAVFGYVYGGHAEVVTPIPPNVIKEAGGGGGVYETPYRRPFELDAVRQGIIVACLAVAAVLVILALYRPQADGKHRSPRYRAD